MLHSTVFPICFTDELTSGKAHAFNLVFSNLFPHKLLSPVNNKKFPVKYDAVNFHMLQYAFMQRNFGSNYYCFYFRILT